MGERERAPSLSAAQDEYLRFESLNLTLSEKTNKSH